MSATSDLYFRQVPVGQMANFAYLVGSLATRETLVVDPAWEIDALVEQAQSDDMQITGALVSHYHQDHIGGSLFGHEIPGLAQLQEQVAVPVHVNREEADGVAKVAGISKGDLVEHDPGDTIELGALRVRLLHTPGHTPGSQCFWVEEAGQPGHLISGDTLFLGSCGRVDLPGGDPEAMYESLHGTLKKLPDETLLFPGHLYSAAGQSTMGEEKRTNPLLRVASLETFLGFMGVGG